MISWTESLVKNFEGMSGPAPGSRPRGRPRKDAAATTAGRSVVVAPGLVPFATSSNLTQQQQQQQHSQQQQQHSQQQDDQHASQQTIFHQQLRIHHEDDDEEEEVDEEVHHHHPHPHHHQHQHSQQQQSQSQQQSQPPQQPSQQQQQNLDCAEEDEFLVRKKKEIKRSWREEWKLQHKWVYPVNKESGELRLKCQWCTTYNMDNVFAKEGCSTIQLSALNTHAKSEAHKTAESRWESSDAAITGLTVLPDNLWGFGDAGDQGGGLDGPELHGSSAAAAAAAAEMNRKRKAAAAAGHQHHHHPSSSSPAGAAGAGRGSSESLGGILQKNNSRIVEVLLEAESGRNRRHAVDVGLAKKQYALEDQRQRLDGERLQFERARLDAVVQLGQQYNAALANIGNGLLKIGAALEQAKKP
ncbi:transcriptional regulator ovo-like isoform X2 [Selaginella moellendorffii]|uniref:transcriptional regulator ovo-like isoform X2 n=1 Tax=Selaginella moellendorffii TaxID=88036 RepID=UPI000D1C289F|nr:transcriptional regulator ovo-like isoform X2 [Selaginella moellendorffii]|eukprot:XP_024527447.1 transcriptional regulator ovo-like isoform X2 [Selaginella moellendorffii]